MTEKDVYKKGVALLEEWEDVNYCEHSFKFKNEWLTDKEVVDLLNKLAEEKEELESFKKLVYLVLKKEYDLKTNEMNIFAEKEDWQGYRATQLEKGTVQRIAKRLGVDLE